MASLEFLEQFNEYLLIKSIGAPLRLFNVTTKQNVVLEGFETPEAFFFLYERDKVICVDNGKMVIYDIHDGTKITDFAG